MKRQKNVLTCSLVLVALIVAVCLLGGLGYLAYRQFLPPIILARREAARPTVAILAPQHGDQIPVASSIVVQVEGRVATGQVVLLQLWADGELVGERSGAAAQLNAQWTWTPRAPGDHTLAARAYNAQRDAGVAIVRVTAIEAADADHDGVPDQADTCPDRAGLLQLDGCPPGMAGGSAGNPEAQEVADAWVGPGAEAEEGAVGEAGGALGGEAEEEAGGEAGGEVGDTDGDGVVDTDDQCPDQAGPADNQGCPRTVSGGGPGTIQGSQQRPEVDDSDFPVGQQAIEENCGFFCDHQEEYPDFELPSGTGLEVEVLSLRTAEGLSDVACYARLQNPQWEQWGRVPDDQDAFFTPIGGGFWDIDDYLGGEHGLGVTVPEGEPLRIEMRCYGRLGDMLTPSLHLGEVTREHGPADWNGQTFTARGQEGANWFDIQYRICGIPCEEDVIPPPYNLRLIRNEGYVTSYVLSWDWQGDATAIDGYHIYRDGNRIATEYGADQRFTILSQSTAEPECSDEYRFEVRAYKGTQESAPSSPAFSAARDSCRNRNELEVHDVILPTPERAVLYVALNYWYDGEHGDQVHVFALPLQGDRPPCWLFEGCSVEFHDLFSLNTGTIEPGQGLISYIAVYYGGTEPMATDGLRLVMMDEDNEWFYMRDVPLAVQWYPSGPDLAWGDINIFSHSRQVEGQIMHDLQFQVVNRGYARLLWEPDFRIRLGDGQLAVPTEDFDDVWLTPGGSASIVWSVPEDIWLRLSPTYEVTLDPDNVIAELNEGNNTFMGAVSTLQITYEQVAFFNHGEELCLFWAQGADGNRYCQHGFVGPGGQLLALMPGPAGPAIYGEMLQFKGVVRDDWADNWSHNDLYYPHEEGLAAPISMDPSAPLWEDLASIFDIINGGCWQQGYMHGTQRFHSREEVCRHLISGGYAPQQNWVEVRHVPGTPQRFSFYFYDMDVHFQWWTLSYEEEYETVCDFYTELTAEQLQNLPGEFNLGSSEQGCMIRVRVEEVANP